MAIKQTQTKMFDFSDTGLDFCVGSKNLFPDRFKKMLALGYNTQTVSSVAVSGNQVTLTYSVSHGYVADRVLKVSSGVLAGINGGEFWIDSVTSNTATLTIDDVPSFAAGGFTTRIAPLGYQLVYELANIHIYKLKALDESDLYLRLCFQDNLNYRNRVGVCLGESANLTSGVITDVNSLEDGRSATTPNLTAFEFTNAANTTYNNYTYSQGASIFGMPCLVGSEYHFAFMYFTANDVRSARISGVFPCAKIGSESLHKAILVTDYSTTPTGIGIMPFLTASSGRAFCGKYEVVFERIVTASTPVDLTPQAYSSFLPSDIEGFNTTTAEPIALYLQGNGQFIGFMYGIYRMKYASTNTPIGGVANNPFKTTDIDFGSILCCHYLSQNGTPDDNKTFYTLPIEEIKIVN